MPSEVSTAEPPVTTPFAILNAPTTLSSMCVVLKFEFFTPCQLSGFAAENSHQSERAVDDAGYRGGNGGEKRNHARLNQGGCPVVAVPVFLGEVGDESEGRAHGCGNQ